MLGTRLGGAFLEEYRFGGTLLFSAIFRLTPLISHPSSRPPPPQLRVSNPGREHILKLSQCRKECRYEDRCGQIPAGAAAAFEANIRDQKKQGLTAVANVT